MTLLKSIPFYSLKNNLKNIPIQFVLCLAFNLLILPAGNSMSTHLKDINCDVKIEHLDCDEDGTPNGEDIAPLDPCLGGTIQLASNDCDGDGVTVGQGDTDDKDFCIPNPQPACENYHIVEEEIDLEEEFDLDDVAIDGASGGVTGIINNPCPTDCLLYTSPSPRDATLSRMPSSA